METSKDPKKLILWQKADELFHMVCRDTKAWPDQRVAKAIVFQLLNAAGSISANIAEGYGRGSPKEFEQFLRFSRGSLAETDSWLSKAHQQNLLSDQRWSEYALRLEELRKISGAFISALRRQSSCAPARSLDRSIA